MKHTNQYGLPTAIYNSLAGGKPPTKGRFSVTDLINAPRQRILKMRHWDEIQEDVSDKLWMLLGKATHAILDGNGSADALTEEKLVLSYKGVEIVGIADSYENGVIDDFKITSVYAFLLGDKPEWERQCNFYAWCYRQLNFDVTALNIQAILRDWVRSKAKHDPEYPPIPFMSVSIPLWSQDAAQAYIDERLALHMEAEATGILPPCTDEERWMKPTTYAVMKKGYKRASRVLDDSFDAESWALANIGEKGWEIQERPGEYTRCRDYCLVKDFCDCNPYREEKAA